MITLHAFHRENLYSEHDQGLAKEKFNTRNVLVYHISNIQRSVAI